MEHDFVGALNFQAPGERNLASSGNIYAEVDSSTGGFKSFVGLNTVPVNVPVFNGRQALTPLTLDTAGFELKHHPLPPVDFYNEHQVLTDYYTEVERFVKESTGAYKVYAFDHVVRNTDVSLNYAVKNGVKLGGAAVFVHGDYALRGAPIRRDHFALPPKIDDTFKKTHGERPLIDPAHMEELKGRRFAIINLWRSFIDDPVVDLPLAMCDCRTVSKDDYAAIQFRYEDRTIDTYLGGHSTGQRWYYFPQMTKDEAILLKTFDSQGVLWKEELDYPYFHANEPPNPASSTLHTAVKDPRLPTDYAKRQSLEVRTIVFY